jgi:hypothetical protein
MGCVGVHQFLSGQLVEYYETEGFRSSVCMGGLQQGREEGIGIVR